VHVHVVILNTVLTTVGKLKSIHARIPKEHDLLVEIAHRNGVGAVGFFADMSDAAVDMARFFDSGLTRGQICDGFFVASYFLDQFEAATDRIEAELPAPSALGAVASTVFRQNEATARGTNPSGFCFRSASPPVTPSGSLAAFERS
jgi:hypothetical protein